MSRRKQSNPKPLKCKLIIFLLVYLPTCSMRIIKKNNVIVNTNFSKYHREYDYRNFKINTVSDE